MWTWLTTPPDDAWAWVAIGAALAAVGLWRNYKYRR